MKCRIIHLSSILDNGITYNVGTNSKDIDASDDDEEHVSPLQLVSNKYASHDEILAAVVNGRPGKQVADNLTPTK